MPHKTARALLAFLLVVAAHAPRAAAAEQTVEQLTVYDAGVGQFVEARTIELQPGVNTVVWRSLMPQAFVRTLRVVAEGAEVVRQDVTYDGPEVRGSRAPVLHLVLRNPGAAGARRVQVDYLAPGVGWHNDYTLVLAPTAEGAPPTAATLDSWVSLLNSTATDIFARRVDLIAGEISLINTGAGGNRYEIDGVQNVAQMARPSESEQSAATMSAPAGALSAFSRFRLGANIAINANAPINRFPLFQNARLEITERNVFENEYNTQTFARGGFILLPRGLEVRLVSRNTTGVPMPAGQVTIYARADGAAAQIVGQDRVPLTPMNGEFSVSQGRSSTLLGTRRVLERRAESYNRESGSTDERLITRVEVVITNRGAREKEAFVRERVEPYDDNVWRVVESSAPSEKLGANLIQFRLKVPAGGAVTLTYTVETN